MVGVVDRGHHRTGGDVGAGDRRAQHDIIEIDAAAIPVRVRSLRAPFAATFSWAPGVISTAVPPSRCTKTLRSPVLLLPKVLLAPRKDHHT